MGRTKKKPLKVSSLTAFKKLPKGTLVTVRNRTGYVVRDHAGMNGLHAAPKNWFEMSEESGDDPLSSGARYFFDEDLEKYFRSGREDNPKKKATKRKANPRKPVKKNASELEGPFTFPNGRVAYYDPGEGKYYDRSNDLYLSESEVESMQSGSKRRAKKNPSRQAGGFYIVDIRVGKVVAGPYSAREADMTLEESAGYDHATHQVMDERYLADPAFKAKRWPGKKKVAKKKATKKNPGKAVRRRPQPRDLLGWEDHAPSSWTPGYQKKIGGRVWEVEMDGGCDPDETDNENSPYSAIASDGQGNRTWFGYRTGDCDYKRLLRGLEKQIRKLMGMDRGRARTMSAWREWTDHDRRRQTAELGTSTKKRANPKGAKKKVAKKKVPWSASDIKGMQEFADRKLGTKKKVAKRKPAKKKATRKTKPEWQLLINRCRKLWDHYCERPSKKRLKPVLEHLEKMKASTSKKVADERKSCLRIANKEARSLKMK